MSSTMCACVSLVSLGACGQTAGTPAPSTDVQHVVQAKIEQKAVAGEGADNVAMPGAEIEAKQVDGEASAKGVEVADTAPAPAPASLDEVAGGGAAVATGSSDDPPLTEKSATPGNQAEKVAAADEQEKVANAEAEQAPQPSSGGINQLGQDLLKVEVARSAEQNVFVSPLSVATALAMLDVGAQGATREQLDRLLRIDQDGPEQIGALGQALVDDVLQMANGIWAANALPIKESYKQVLAREFHAEAANVDFSEGGTLERINQWFSDKTAGLIDNMFDQLPASTQMVLGNALHFKSKWLNAFDPARTSPAPFHGADGDHEVEMMHREFDYLPYDESELAQMIALPFLDGSFELRVILPRKGTPVARILDAPEIWAEADYSQLVPVSLSLPKIKLDLGGSINLALQQLGLTSPFDDSSNFEQVSEQPLQVSEVIHRISLTVDESGAEAAAATGVAMTRSAGFSVPRVRLEVDRPFLLQLRDKRSHTIILAGVVNALPPASQSELPIMGKE